MSNTEQLIGALKKARKVVVCGHSMPDGDSVGTTLATGILLKSMGKEVTMISPDPIPKMYGFLPMVKEIGTAEDVPEDIDTAVIVDCTDLNRTGPVLSQLLAKIPVIINIDHHISNQVYGNYNYVDEKAAAAGEQIFKIIKLINQTITKDMAICLYTALVMDTGSFKYENTTDQTHLITAELLSAGINVAQISNHLFEKKEIQALRLIGKALSLLKISDCGKIAWISLPLKMMQDLGAKDEHAEGIVNYPRMVEGSLVGLLFREISPNKIKVGFRSKDVVDVNKIAAELGGGGHPRAAGCQLEMSLEEAEDKVLKVVYSYIDSLKE